MDSGISTSETGGTTSGKTFMERLKAQNARHKQQLEEKRKKLEAKQKENQRPAVSHSLNAFNISVNTSQAVDNDKPINSTLPEPPKAPLSSRQSVFRTPAGRGDRHKQINQLKLSPIVPNLAEHTPKTPGHSGVKKSREEKDKMSFASPHFSKLKRSVSLLSDLDDNLIVVKGKSYRKLTLLGKGGSCKVYEAVDEQSQVVYAIKIAELPEDEGLRRSLINEVLLLERLQDSRYVIRMKDYDMDESSNRLYVVMERGDTDFASFLTRNADSINTRFIHFYWEQMLRAVKVIHDQNIVHADLKPANFLLVRGNLKLIDFGISSSAHENKKKSAIVGTLDYMAPEQFTDEQPQVKIDVWALGCILYRIVYGKLPFADVPRSDRINKICDPRFAIRFNPIEDEIILRSIKRCLERNYEKRASIDELLQLLADSSSAPGAEASIDYAALASEMQGATPKTLAKKLKRLVLQSQTRKKLNFDD
ncbi:hypothetical protein WR25_21876 [Diploscapter pachys]|uniref:Protein kinase domain-containing protein n=1 Tax=Diploscapter pachys TaxID=2018661 RepID=A0A2A2M0K8_9BILA|nr:hypothetical protein WR25_21876 [Diploscapter pachys]